MLIIHGEKDYRVPISEALALFEGLRMHDVEAELELDDPLDRDWDRPLCMVFGQKVVRLLTDVLGLLGHMACNKKEESPPTAAPSPQKPAETEVATPTPESDLDAMQLLVEVQEMLPDAARDRL